MELLCQTPYMRGMPERSRKHAEVPAEPEKDPIAAELGRRGGIKGGRARAERLSPEMRRAIAQRAAAMRWAKKAERPQPRLPGTPTTREVGTLSLAGRALQVARLEDGRRLVGQLSIETALDMPLPADMAVVTFHVPGEWQVRRGIPIDILVPQLALHAAKGHAVALALLAACATTGFSALVDEAAARKG
jgi:hypothetical protein